MCALMGDGGSKLVWIYRLKLRKLAWRVSVSCLPGRCGVRECDPWDIPRG